MGIEPMHAGATIQCVNRFTKAAINRQLPILPGRLQPSTFGVYVLNYCVRNGNRWDHIAIITGYSIGSMYLQNYTETRIILVSAF